LPDYADKRKWLKENGRQFYWDWFDSTALGSGL